MDVRIFKKSESRGIIIARTRELDLHHQIYQFTPIFLPCWDPL